MRLVHIENKDYLVVDGERDCSCFGCHFDTTYNYASPNCALSGNHNCPCDDNEILKESIFEPFETAEIEQPIKPEKEFRYYLYTDIDYSNCYSKYSDDVLRLLNEGWSPFFAPSINNHEKDGDHVVTIYQQFWRYKKVGEK